MSYFEIYNEKIRDLLDRNNIKYVRENVKEGFYVERLKEVAFKTQEEFEKSFRKGTLDRMTKSTLMN